VLCLRRLILHTRIRITNKANKMKAVEIAFTIFFNVATLGMWGLGTYLNEKKKKVITEQIDAFLTAPTTTTESRARWQYVYAILCDKTATAVPALFHMLSQIVKKKHCASPNGNNRSRTKKSCESWGAYAYYGFAKDDIITLVQDWELKIFCGDLEAMYKLLKNIKSMDKLAQVCYIIDNLEAFYHLVLCASRAKKLKDARFAWFSKVYTISHHWTDCDVCYPDANTSFNPLDGPLVDSIPQPKTWIPD
jgi:hypothetical protein